jgi:phenylacetaldehyde dehydrogenase
MQKGRVLIGGQGPHRPAKRFRVSPRLATVDAEADGASCETPFGATKPSGLGRDGGEFGLHVRSELRSVVWPG